MKKYFSHIWPITKKIKSSENGTLELTWIDGKKVLDSANANYSYGSLQKVLNYGISQIDLNEVSKILILGLGGGSVIHSLRNKFNFQNKITAIEIDSVIIDIAKTEFGITNDKNTKIICTDAVSFINSCNQEYDLIIIDLFIDCTVPEVFYGIPFWQKITTIVAPEKYVIFNAGVHLDDTTKIGALIAEFDAEFEFTIYDQVEGSNTLLIGKMLF